MKRMLGYCLLAVAIQLSPSSAQAQEKEKESGRKLEKAEVKEVEGLEIPELGEDSTLEEAEAVRDAVGKLRPRSYDEAMQLRTASLAANKRIIALLEEAGETNDAKYFDAKREIVGSRLADLSNPAKSDKAADEIMAFLSSLGENFTERDGQLATMAGYYMTNAPKADAKTSEKFFAALVKILKASEVDNEENIAMLEGFVRRKNLIGETLKLSGTKMDGEAFDIADLKGKVVLVDFWATWCGPCVAEHPNIEKNYEAYSEQGFEVVGISLDRNRGQLEKFVEEHDTKWIVLHDEGGKNAATTYYGVMGIPSMFLLDQEGKVVSTTARGPRLGKELAKLLGEPAADEEESPAVTLESAEGDSN